MTAKICNILFPVDLSHQSVLAAQHVKIWVDRFGAVLHTLHILDAEALGYSSERRDDFLYNELPALIVKRTADLEYFSDHYFGENVARHTVLSGGTADQIEYFAKRENIDLIMLPRNHQNLAFRMLLLEDSLAAKLLERCTASVWLTEHIDDVSPSPVHSILCAIHLEQDVTLDAQNNRMLQTVRELAITFQARVVLLHVTNRAAEESGESVTHLQAVAGIEPLMAQARALFGSSAEILRESGDVITAISNTAKQLATDLIVVGRTRPGTIGLGRQTHVLKIDHATRRPVFSVW
jgi:nucleotide-binding universal stress UspA family protein